MWMDMWPVEKVATYNRLSTVPEYLNVLGPSAKVNGKGPEISQLSVLGQKMLYVVAVLSCNLSQHENKPLCTRPPSAASGNEGLLSGRIQENPYAGNDTARQILPILTSIARHINRYGGLGGGRWCQARRQDSGGQEGQRQLAAALHSVGEPLRGGGQQLWFNFPGGATAQQPLGFSSMVGPRSFVTCNDGSRRDLDEDAKRSGAKQSKRKLLPFPSRFDSR